jgi:hypothetical protein
VPKANQITTLKIKNKNSLQLELEIGHASLQSDNNCMPYFIFVIDPKVAYSNNTHERKKVRRPIIEPQHLHRISA